MTLTQLGIVSGRIYVAAVTLMTMLPLMPSGVWAIRVLDFPRIQIAVLAMIPILVIFYREGVSSWSAETGFLFAVCLTVSCWQVLHVIKYTPLWEKELFDANQESQHALTVTVINLQFENREKEAVIQQLKSLDSDLLLLIEIDESWSKALAELESEFPHREGVVREKGVGMMLWSQVPFEEAEVRHLVSKNRASIFARLKLDNQVVNFVGVHPPPPGLKVQGDEGRRDSRIRDAELMIIAKTIAQRQNEKWIVAGDFNDVAWSHTTRLFKRISGLADPRVGRGLFNTYHADYPILRFPIDQIFLSPGTGIVNLSRFHPTGSDHYAISTTFTMKPNDPHGAEPGPVGNDKQDANEMINEGQADADDLEE